VRPDADGDVGPAAGAGAADEEEDKVDDERGDEGMPVDVGVDVGVGFGESVGVSTVAPVTPSKGDKSSAAKIAENDGNDFCAPSISTHNSWSRDSIKI